MNAMSLETRIVPDLAELADRLVSSGEVTVALAAVARDDRLVWGAAGSLGSLQTRFDIASVTKPFAATAALLLDRRQILGLDTHLADLVGGLPEPGRHARVADLFRHSAGLIPWFPFYVESTGAPTLERFSDPGLWQPVDTTGVYSDLGPILWRLMAEEAGVRVATLLADSGTTATWSPDPTTTAATILANRREVELAAALGIEIAEETVERRGVPQDGNARFIPDSAHAGLFATAAELIALGQEWLRPQILTAEEVESSLRSEGRYAFGWWRANAEQDALPESAFGHNGFTGCSLWIDRESARVVTLLAHRAVLSDTLDRVRRDFHRLALTIPI